MRHFFRTLVGLVAFSFLMQTAAAFEFALIPASVYGAFQSGSGVGWDTITHLLLHLIQLLITIAGAVAVIMLMIAGFQYIFATIYEDNSEAKNTIRGALIGFVVVLMSWVIIDFLIAFLTL